MLGFYNYTVILTYLSLLSSAIGIYGAINGYLNLSLCLLLLSGIFDMFDGKVARTKKDRTEDEKRFGIQIDSLSDLVCFNVLPSVIGFTIIDNEIWKVIILSLYMLTGVIRLSYFNVMEENRQKVEKKKRKIYQGLPVTISGFVVPFFLLFRNIIANFNVYYVLLLLILGVLQISPIKIYRPSKEE